MGKLGVYLVSFEEDKITYTMELHSADIYIGWITAETCFFDTNNQETDWQTIHTLKIQGRAQRCEIERNGELLISLRPSD